MRLSILLSTLLLVPLAAAGAQDLPLQPGQRVRVTVPSVDVSKQKATFQRIAHDTLVLSSASYALSDVTQLEVQGRRSNWDRGALYGGVAVGAVGLGLGIAWMVECDKGGELCPDPPAASLLLAPIGFLAGGVLGAGIGALTTRDKWEQVPLERLHVGPVAMRNGRIGFGLSMTF